MAFVVKCSILVVTRECLEEVNRFCAFVDVNFVVFVQVEMFNSCGNRGMLEEVNRVHAFVE